MLQGRDMSGTITSLGELEGLITAPLLDNHVLRENGKDVTPMKRFGGGTTIRGQEHMRGDSDNSNGLLG